jgi:hypothetical protein
LNACHARKAAHNIGMRNTVRNISKQLDQFLRAKAKAEGRSPNSVTIELLEQGLGLNGQPKTHHDMDDLFGSGPLEKAVLKAIAEQDVVNPDGWR